MLINRHPYLMAEPGAAGAAADTMDVDLPGGVKVTLPKADAQKVIAERDKRGAEYRALAEKVGAVEAAKAEAEAKAATETRRAQETELAKKGEIDELRKLMTGDKDKALGALSSKLLRLQVSQVVATNARVVPESRDDVVSLLMSSSGFKLEGDSIKVVDADGKPLLDQAGQAIGTDAFIASWLEKRPHYLLDSTPSGSGAAGGIKRAPTKAISHAQVESMSPGDLAKHFAEGGTLA